MARRISDIERPPTRRDPRALAEHLQVCFRHRNHLPPQPRDPLDTPELIRAVDQFRRIDDMWSALLVHEHPYARVVADQQAGGPRMIEMDVRDEYRLDVADADSLRRERCAERVDARSRARVDQYGAAIARVDTRGNRLRRVAEIQVDIGDIRGNRGHAASLSSETNCRSDRTTTSMNAGLRFRR